MAGYSLTTFDGVQLPLYNPAQGIPLEIPSLLLDYGGGAVDTWGSADRAPSGRTIRTLRGIYAGQSGTLDPLTDDTGAPLDLHGAAADLQIQLDDLLSRLGHKGQLYRTRLADGVQQWAPARLMKASRSPSVKDRDLIAELDLSFESSDPYWRSSSKTTTTAALTAERDNGLLVDGGGDCVILDGILTITASASITTITITSSALGIDLRWAGALSSGKKLIIDNGAQTITAAGADAFSGLTIGSNHTAASWIPLDPGLSLLIIRPDGAADASIAFYSAFL